MLASRKLYMSATPDMLANAATGDASVVTGGGDAVASTASGHGTDKLVVRGSVEATPDAGVADAGHHTSHHEVHHKHRRKLFGLGADSDRSFGRAVGDAWEASKGELLPGAAMFAGFATLLGLCIYGVSLAVGATAIPGMVGPEAFKLLVGGIGAAIAGATWMGGNKFYKKYKEVKQGHSADDEKENDIALGKDGASKEKAKAQETEYSPRDIGELGLIGGALTSYPATTTFIIEVPEEAMQSPAQQSEAIRAILENGPRSRSGDAIAQGSQADLSPAERAERVKMAAEQQASL